MASVVSVNISEQKGTRKHPVPQIELRTRHGIVGDAHAGDWHRQVSLLAEESVDSMRAQGAALRAGDFAENINTEGIDLKALPVGARLRVGEAELEVTQIGKECHSDCEIKRLTGRCVMPTEGIFAVVVQAGVVRAGDCVSIVEAGLMRCIPTKDAAGHVLCHDLTQILPGQFKGARFHKGHVVRKEDIPVLLRMGKEHLYVWELSPGMVHEDDAAERLCALAMGPHMRRSDEIREGKLELFADCDGFFQVDEERLLAVNSVPDVMVATRKGGTAVKAGDKLAGMRVIPLVVAEETLRAAQAAAGNAPLLELLPYRLRRAGIVTTGSEVKKGLIEDKFTPAVRRKLEEVGMEVVAQAVPGDGVEDIAAAIAEVRRAGVDLLLCTGGMSVDPDDNTPGAIRRSGADIVSYGAPVLPGAMFLLGYYGDGLPVLGLPGCVMFAGATVFDLVLPRLAAGLRVTREDLLRLGNGGLCLGCRPCHWPDCPFGR